MSGFLEFWRSLWSAIEGFGRNDGSPMAGFIAFSGFLSLFPFMIFAATLIGILVGQTESDEIIDALFEIAPEHLARTLEPVISEVLNKNNEGILTLSAMFAIWIASNAVEAFRIAFDRAYEVDDPRTFFENRALAIILVFVGAVVAALLGVSIILSPIIISVVDEHLPGRLPPMAGYATYAIGIIVFMGFMLLMHRVLPGRSMRGTRLWPGVIVTTVLWIAAARLFTVYLSSAASYTVTYGTLAGVIIALMFFYITGATIIFGAEFNAAVDRRERHRNARMLLT